MTHEPRDTVQPKIGDIVRANLDTIARYCASVAPHELDQLADLDYSKQTFGLNFPFWKPAEEIVPKSAEHSRYWTAVLDVNGRPMRVTSQWYARHLDQFLNYLAERGLATQSQAQRPAAAVVEARAAAVAVAATSKSRYKGKAIGDSQNAFVRTLLSNLGVESFKEKDWLATKAHFDQRCVYCGADDNELVMDHAIPINRTSLGEHRLGNLVPACHPCNSAKGKKDFRDFPALDLAAVGKIEAFMDSRGYEPLGDDERVRLFLNTAYAEVGALAERYLTLLNFGPMSADN